MLSKPSSVMRLLLYSSVVLTASAGVIRAPLESRADPQNLEDCQLEIQDEMANDPNRANTDGGTSGIGAEFETAEFYFETDCDSENTNAAKYKVVAGRKGDNWQLTADSTGDNGHLNAEYIIDGTQIKVGSTDDATNGAKVAAAMGQDLIDWKPWTGDEAARMVDIADNKCNPWRIMTPKNVDPKRVEWQAQITTGMPLEALYSLMKENKKSPNPPDRNILDGIDREDGAYLNLVTKTHFQTSPGGIGPDKATDDVLAFCTLVLSYAKIAMDHADGSPKLWTAFMPRTHFNKLLSHVSSKLPAKGNDLWAMFNVLACYQSDNDGERIDENYCGGTLASPQPSGNKFGGLTFSSGNERCNIREWIQGLDPESEDQDALSKWDAKINDGSIGRLGTKEEKMFNSQRLVPLFEFRDSLPVFTETMGEYVGKVDKAIQDLHNNFANAPGKKVRRGICGNAEPRPQPEPEPEPQPTGPTKQLAVLSSFVAGARTLDWIFLEADFEQGVGCRGDFLRPFDTEPWDLSGKGAQAGSTFPGGTRDLELTIDGQKCQYKNDGDDPGALWCGERVIGCKNDPADKNPEDANSDKGNYKCGDYTRQPVFVCPY